jgi:predicted nucleic acid-binding protein
MGARLMILVDTNIPLRLIQMGHPHQAAALDALALLKSRDQEEFGIAPQSLYEMYVVCTRPLAQNGLGLTPAQGHHEIAQVRGLFQLLPETGQVYSTWEDLIARYGVSGKPAHDTRLVAIMLVSGINRILTFNDADFARYAEIKALNPFDLLALPRS